MASSLKVGDLIEAESVDGAWEELRVTELAPGPGRHPGVFRVEATANSFGPLKQPTAFSFTAEGTTWRRKKPTRGLSETVANKFWNEDAEAVGAGFMECAACREKPGSPLLCEACQHNRLLIGRLANNLAEVKTLVKSQEDTLLFERRVANENYERIVLRLKQAEIDLSVARSALANSEQQRIALLQGARPVTRDEKLALVLHVAFCENCTQNSVMAPEERRRGVRGDESMKYWNCVEGRRLSRAAEGVS